MTIEDLRLMLPAARQQAVLNAHPDWSVSRIAGLPAYTSTNPNGPIRRFHGFVGVDEEKILFPQN